MENTNQRLKIELEDKEIEHQSEGETTMAVMPCLNFEEDKKIISSFFNTLGKKTVLGR